MQQTQCLLPNSNTAQFTVQYLITILQQAYGKPQTSRPFRRNLQTRKIHIFDVVFVPPIWALDMKVRKRDKEGEFEKR
jgi:hypothetical protein